MLDCPENCLNAVPVCQRSQLLPYEAQLLFFRQAKLYGNIFVNYQGSGNNLSAAVKHIYITILPAQNKYISGSMIYHNRGESRVQPTPSFILGVSG
ncbi:hypothetical protein ACQE32_01045 [Pantoea sp. FN0302]|uniref:hypothetical protein n=1 Tax=unclassified Pantoea TaxID=2630326 RepID=UPI003CF736E9